MSVSVALRIATITDAAVLAAHRVARFREMGSVKPTVSKAARGFGCLLYPGDSLGRVRGLGSA